MVNKKKCNFCRCSKQRCTPEDRKWDLYEKVKCENCIKGNKPCSANEEPPDRALQESGSSLLEVNYTRSAGLPTELDVTKEYMETSMGPTEKRQTNLTCSSKELRQSLEQLEALAEYVNQAQHSVEEVKGKGVLGYNPEILGPQYSDLSGLQEVTVRNLVEKLHDVESRAYRAQIVGEIDLAEVAYTRVLDVYRRQLPHFCYSISCLLEKMGSFHWSINQPLRAQKCWWDICRTRDPSGQAHCIEQRAWKKLFVTLPKTSGIIAKAFQSRYSNEMNFETAFPPLQTMIKSGHASNTCREKISNNSSLEDNSAPTFPSMIDHDVGHLAEIIRNTRDEDLDLETKDMLQRTPLFVAASKKQEDVGYAILGRMDGLHFADQERHMNARDIFGQTVLGAATEACCSTDFIKALIKLGASVDPHQLKPFTLTPLQAACLTSNVDLVELFLIQHASTDRVFPGNPLPLELAICSPNLRIAQLITGQVKVSGKKVAIDASRVNVFAEWDSEMEKTEFPIVGDETNEIS